MYKVLRRNWGIFFNITSWNFLRTNSCRLRFLCSIQLRNGSWEITWLQKFGPFRFFRSTTWSVACEEFFIRARRFCFQIITMELHFLLFLLIVLLVENPPSSFVIAISTILQLQRKVLLVFIFSYLFIE